MDPIECAKKGDIEFFKKAKKHLLLHARDGDDYSVLDISVMGCDVDCCKEICKKCPELLYHQNRRDEVTVLHHAALRGDTKMINFLITAANEFENDDMKAGGGENVPKRFLRMLDRTDKYGVWFAVIGNKLEAAKLLLDADPEFIHNADASDTPLLKAMTEAKMGNSIAAKVRKLIFEIQPFQIKIRRGEKKWTLLHLSSSNGDLDSIDEIIRFCPECTELVDVDNRNFLHIAVMSGKANVVNHVLENKDLTSSVLNAQDRDGNTPLHVAALSGNVEITSFLVYDTRVFKMSVNVKGERVLDAVKFDYDKARAQVSGASREKMDEQELKDQSDYDLVVGALIAAVSFTAGITVPGGYIKDGPNQGKAALWKETAFETFVVSNTVALVLSVYAVFCHFCISRLLRKKDIEIQLTLAMYCTLGAILAMVVAFISASYAVLEISNGLAIIVIVICCTFYFFTFWAIWRMVNQYKQPFSWSSWSHLYRLLR